MKRVKTQQELIECLQYLDKLTTGKTNVFREPIVPDDCRTFDESTAEYINGKLKLYVNTWIRPIIEDAITELSK